MSERSGLRRPATFKLDDPHVVVLDPDEAAGRLARGSISITPEADPCVAARTDRGTAGSGAEGISLGRAVLVVTGGLVVLGTGSAMVV